MTHPPSVRAPTVAAQLAEVAQFAASTHIRVVTPGAEAGELLHVLSSLERRSSRWDTDIDGARAALSAAVSLILRLLGRDPDPAKSREHVLLSVLAERRLAAGQSADLATLLPKVVAPPTSIGALGVDAFLPKRARRELAAALNTLLAAPTFASWRKGLTLDIGEWMQPVDGRTPATVLSVAHLDDDERAWSPARSACAPSSSSTRSTASYRRTPPAPRPSAPSSPS